MSSTDFSARLALRVLQSLTHLNDQLREAREAINRADESAPPPPYAAVSGDVVLPPPAVPTPIVVLPPPLEVPPAHHTPPRAPSPSRRGNTRGGDASADALVNFLLCPALASDDESAAAALSDAAAAAGISSEMLDAVRAHWAAAAAHHTRRGGHAAIHVDAADHAHESFLDRARNVTEPGAPPTPLGDASPQLTPLARSQPPPPPEPLLRELTEVDFEVRNFVFARYREPVGSGDCGGFGDIPVDTDTLDEEDFVFSEAQCVKAAPPVIADTFDDDDVDDVDYSGGFAVSVRVAKPRVRAWKGGDIKWPHVVETVSLSDASSGSVEREARSGFELATGSPDVSSNGASGAARALRFDAFSLPVVYQSGRTGFSDTKEFSAAPNTVIAGRFRVHDTVGNAAFSSAMSCTDLATEKAVCLKVVKNNKDFVDQSLDEIKLLRYLNSHADAETEEEGVSGADQFCILKLHEYFYFQEHLFLVTELLKDNLYDFSEYIRKHEGEPYFTIPRLQHIARQVLTALDFIHSCGILHCDLKPENILIKSYSLAAVKVIDFGSSCLVTDRVSSYVCSRSYRAPEIILGQAYNAKIDVWSLGCILAEQYSGNVLFANDSVQTILARMQSVLGAFPEHMLDGPDAPKWFTADRSGRVYERTGTAEAADGVLVYTPRRTNLATVLNLNTIQAEEAGFLDFLAALLQIDPERRPTAREALEHPWLREQLPFEPYRLPL